jgi:hypothetical protein
MNSPAPVQCPSCGRLAASPSSNLCADALLGRPCAPVLTGLPGQLVYFGRSHGEKTLGEVVRWNRATVKVKQLEARGSFKAHKIGTLWNVAKSLVSAAPKNAKPEGGTWSQDSGGAYYTPPVSNLVETPVPGSRAALEAEIARLKSENAALKRKPRPAPVGDNGHRDPLAARFAAKPKRPEAEIMRDILGVYNELSPENLTCDGEFRAAQVRSRYRALQGQLAKLFREIGRTVSEDEAFKSARG